MALLIKPAEISSIIFSEDCRSLSVECQRLLARYRLEDIAVKVVASAALVRDV